MDLSEQQQRIIKEWAARTPLIDEVRLFGSRAMGDAPAVTKLLEPLRAHVNLYNAEGEKVRRICEEFSVLLYP